MITFAFLETLSTSADIVLFLVTNLVFFGILFFGLRIALSNLSLARRQRNRKAIKLTIGAPLLLLALTVFFNLSPASRTEVFLLIPLAAGMTYVESEVQQQLSHRQERRRVHR